MKTKKEHILELLNNSSGRLNEKYFIKHLKSEYDKIIEYCVDVNDIPFKQKIWHYVNDKPNYILCKTCGVNKTTFHKNWLDGYRQYCSSKCSLSNEETKLKREIKCEVIYGFKNAAKNEDVKIKTAKKNIEIYGHKSSFQNIEVRKKWKLKVKETYDVDHVFQMASFDKTASQKKKKELYGDANMFKTDHFKEKSKESRSILVLNKYKERLDELEYEILEYKSSIFSIKHSCGEIFEIHNVNIRDRYFADISLCTKCFPISDNDSIAEKDLYNYVENLVGVNNVEKTRKILKNTKELDIYIPSKNLAIELNGLYYHSELFHDNNYHLNKSLECKEKDISLIHIFEDEWKFKKEIVKSIITNRLGCIENKIYARKCIIKEVSSNDAKHFLNINHIQGFAASTYKLGLYHNDTLVSLMTFGYRTTNRKKHFELIRFCNLLNTNVIGAASKLFKHFVNNYEYGDSIISYSDFRMFDGKMYENLGFEYKHLTKPDYYWCNHGKARIHKSNFTHKKLVDAGYDKNMSEIEIMHSRKYYRIWNCGLVKWIYQKSVS